MVLRIKTQVDLEAGRDLTAKPGETASESALKGTGFDFKPLTQDGGRSAPSKLQTNLPGRCHWHIFCTGCAGRGE